jgi:hypothetical protein
LLFFDDHTTGLGAGRDLGTPFSLGQNAMTLCVFS